MKRPIFTTFFSQLRGQGDPQVLQGSVHHRTWLSADANAVQESQAEGAQDEVQGGGEEEQTPDWEGAKVPGVRYGVLAGGLWRNDNKIIINLLAIASTLLVNRISKKKMFFEGI